MENEPIEITFPPEVIDAATAEDAAVADGTYEEPTEDENKSGEGEGESEETKPDAEGETNEGGEGEGEGEGSEEAEEGEEGSETDSEEKPFADFELDGKPHYVVDKEGNKHDLKKVVEDQMNNLNWSKTNTEKNQDLSRREDELTARASTFALDDVVKALSDNDGELLTAMDKWFDPAPEGKEDHVPDQSKNPLRNIPGPIREHTAKEVTEANAKAQVQEKEDKEAVALEYSELGKIDERYKDEAKRLANGEDLRPDDLMTRALQPLTLMEAHTLREADGLATKVTKLTTELAARNKELTALRKSKGPSADGLDEGIDGKGARSSTSDDGKVESFDAQMKKAEKQFLGK